MEAIVEDTVGDLLRWEGQEVKVSHSLDSEQIEGQEQ